MRRTAWVEINLKAISDNLKLIKKIAGKKVKVMSIVKSNAYGHGAVEVAKRLQKNKVDIFGVITLGEALELKKNGIKTPVLILMPGFVKQAEEIVKNGFRQTVCTLEMAKALSNAAKKLNKKAIVHIKVDTGMGRLGIYPEETLDFMNKIKKYGNIEIEGIFTHFSSADENNLNYTKKQLDIFKNLIKKLSENGINIPLKHAACSAAVMKFAGSYLNVIRPGLMLYGILPYFSFSSRFKLKPALSFKTRVIFVKTIKKGTFVGYSRTFKAKKETKVAVLGVGYVDGYSRRLSNTGEVIIKGKKAPVIGRVCMDQVMIDVSGVKNVKIEDEVILLGRSGNVRVTAEEIADKIGTIPYDVVCMINSNLERIITQK